MVVYFTIYYVAVATKITSTIEWIIHNENVSVQSFNYLAPYLAITITN